MCIARRWWRGMMSFLRIFRARGGGGGCYLPSGLWEGKEGGKGALAFFGLDWPVRWRGRACMREEVQRQRDT